MTARVSDELFKHGLSFPGREGIAGDASGQGFGGIGDKADGAMLIFKIVELCILSPDKELVGTIVPPCGQAVPYS